MRNHKNSILKALVIVAILAYVIFNSSKISNGLRVRSIDLYAPTLNAFRSLTTSIDAILPFASIRNENKILKQNNELLTRKLAEASLLSDENRRLKTLLNFKKIIPFTTISAQVIGRDPSNWSNSVIVNKGLSHGIKPNGAVLSTRGLVGRVLETGRYSSKILLISDPNSRVGVIIQRNGQGGILIGRPDNICKMIYIALDSDVAPGDKVYTAGFGTIFPKGILVGEVVKVGKEPGRLYKYALVRPSQTMSRLEEVLCIK